MADGAGNGPGCSITQRTNGVAFYFLGYIYQQIHIAQAAVAVLQAVQYLFHPAGSFAAGRTLSAAFMVVKAGKVPGVAHNALILIKGNKTARTHHGTGSKSAVGQ